MNTIRFPSRCDTNTIQFPSTCNTNTIQLSGGSVIVGEVGSGKSNVQITSGAINLRNNTSNKLVLGADGSISIGNDFSVDSSGNASFAGTLSIGSYLLVLCLVLLS